MWVNSKLRVSPVKSGSQQMQFCVKYSLFLGSLPQRSAELAFIVLSVNWLSFVFFKIVILFNFISPFVLWILSKLLTGD